MNRSCWLLGVFLSITYVSAQEKLGGISGTVVDAGERGLDSEIDVLGPTHLRMIADRSGEFVATGLKPGAYTLRFALAGFQIHEISTLVTEGAATDLGHVRLELAPLQPCIEKAHKPRISSTRMGQDALSKLAGVTRTDSGRVLSRFTIALLVSGNPQPIAEAVTDDRGRFEFLGLGQGFYDLEISYEGRRLTSVSKVRMKPGYAVEVTISWSAPQICI
jgi:hypothetical protein